MAGQALSIFIDPSSTQVNSDWDAVTGVEEILNKPDLDIYEEVANKVDDLLSPDNTTYPTTSAVTDYVNLVLQGIESTSAVDCATTTFLPNSPTYNNGAAGVGATLTSGTLSALVVDGHTVLLGEHVLVKNQTATTGAATNGVYELTTLGVDAATAWILTRSTAYDTAAEINAIGSLPIIFGSANETTSWVLISFVTTIGTDALLYQQFTLTPSTIALITNTLGQFAATNSNQLRGIMSDSTGTGSLTFATSPTFTTPNIGVATGSVSGNAGTATILQTARNINGISFNGSANILLNNVFNDQTGTTYTFASTDNQKIVTGTNSSTQTFTVPPNSSVNFPIGAQIDVVQAGTGKITISPGVGVTIISKGSLTSTNGRGVGVSIVQSSTTDTWFLFGDLVA